MSAVIIHPKESYAIIGACFAVYNEQGCGFTEDVYQECLEMELADLSIPFVAQKELPLTYKGRRLRRKFKTDFLCYEKIVLEIKAVSHLTDEHRAQVQNYLHATGLELGLLVNFGHYPKLESERIAMTTQKARHTSLPDDFRL
ncbi:MAG: GxxExxY protein [Limisphaerales bacterium]